MLENIRCKTRWSYNIWRCGCYPNGSILIERTFCNLLKSTWICGGSALQIIWMAIGMNRFLLFSLVLFYTQFPICYHHLTHICTWIVLCCAFSHCLGTYGQFSYSNVAGDNANPPKSFDPIFKDRIVEWFTMYENKEALFEVSLYKILHWFSVNFTLNLHHPHI